MNNLMKISAFIILFAMIIMFTGAVSAANATVNSGNNVQSAVGDDDNIDWDHIDYGSPPQGDNCSGVAVEVDDTGYAGIVHTLTNAQYKEMWKRIAKWQAAQHTTRLPNYVTISDMKVGIDKVTKDQFLDMKKRWDAWKSSHSGKEPNSIGIEGPVSGVTSAVGPIQKALMDAVGQFKSFTGFYKLCKNRKYAYYFDDKYARSPAIKRLKERSGLNCVDISQLGYDLAKEMGYEVKYQRTTCRKSDGTYVGHILLKIKGKEFNSWKIVDLAACIYDGKALGRYWGKPPYDIDRYWLNVDDGR